MSAAKQKRMREYRYLRPIIRFERKIGSTVYTVNARFDENAAETIEKKTERMLRQRTSF